MRMPPSENSQLNDPFRRYCADLAAGLRQWWTRFAPLSIDPLSSGAFQQGGVLQQSALRRGMGIIEAERALKRFVLVGEPGSGKSAALQYLALFHAQSLSGQPVDGGHQAGSPDMRRIPIFIELNMYRKPDSGSGILQLITDQLYPYFFSRELTGIIEENLSSGTLLVILDGLNECPRAFRAHAVRDIKTFLTRYSHTPVILSCRTRDYPDIFHLSILAVRPLNRQAVDRLIFTSLPASPDQKEQAGRLKELLYERYADFIRLPLLLSIVLEVFRESQWEIPSNRGALFRRFFELWFRRESIKLRTAAPTTRIMFMFGLAGGIACMMQNRGEVRTSREKIWSFICGYLEKHVERHIVSGERYKADALLDELLGMGLLIESGAMVKFYHQLFQEFLAGYHLGSERMDEALIRLEHSWWEQPLLFFAGITENATPLIRQALENGDVFGAAHLLESCGTCDAAVYPVIYRRLLELLFDRYSCNRRRAFDCLCNFRDERIDTVLQEFIDGGESAQAVETYAALLQERKRRFARSGRYPLPGMPAPGDMPAPGGVDRVTDIHFDYSGSVSQVVRRIERTIADEGVEPGAVLFRKAVRSAGSAAMEHALRRILAAVRDPNRLLFIVWCLSQVLEKRGIDILMQDVPEEAAAAALPDMYRWKSPPAPDIRLFFNILFNPDIHRVWQLELAQYEFLCVHDSGTDALFAEALGSLIDRPRCDCAHVEFLLQIFWDLDAAAAECFLLEWMKERMSRPAGKTVVTFLADRGVGSAYADACRALMQHAPPELRKYFPEMVGKTGTQHTLGFLMNLARDERNAPDVRGAAVAAMRWQAGPQEKVFLEELLNSPYPELYDPAYEILVDLRKRLKEDDKMLKAESAEDLSVELLFDEEPEAPVRGETRIRLYESDRRSAAINGVRILFGPVSGRIFYFLAKNSTLGRYYSVRDIQAYLEIHDLVLDDASVRNRITDIRKRIQRALEGRVDPRRLLENARRYGYRINAGVEIE